MARPKQTKHKQRVNLTLDPKILEQAKKLAEEYGISLSALVEATLRQHWGLKSSLPK
jgi:antitoxin component of RelBE/YafQ-DinJ toxin-antitoxin module